MLTSFDTGLTMEKRKADVALYDKLGPLTRELIDQSPINITVADFLPAFRRENAKARGWIDPDDPKSVARAVAFQTGEDERMRDFLLKKIRERVPGFQPIVVVKRRKRHG